MSNPGAGRRKGRKRDDDRARERARSEATTSHAGEHRYRRSRMELKGLGARAGLKRRCCRTERTRKSGRWGSR